MTDAASLRAADAEARRLAQTAFARPLVLEAGAGTGKTTTLVARVVAWCVGPGWDVAVQALSASLSVLATAEQRAEARDPDRVASRVLEGVVAITFTDAAAAEMATRVGEALTDVAEGAVPVGMRSEALPGGADGRARALLGALDRLVVRTIHAFCRRLLARFPIEARLHPQFDVDADGTAAADVVRAVVDASVREAWDGEPDVDHLALALDGTGPPELEAVVLALTSAAVPAEALDGPLFPADLVDAAIEAVGAAGAAFLGSGGAALDAGRANAKGRAVVAAVRATAPGPAADGEPEQRLAAFTERVGAAWDDSLLGRLRDWAAGAFNASESKLLEAVGAAERDVQANAVALSEALGRLVGVDPERLSRLARVVRPMVSDVAGRLRASGVQTFSALLRDAADLLADHPDVRSVVRRGLQQLLVDEFQDTDPRQCEIVGLLALDGPAAERPGLFIVGDPKQSIYGWRSADLRAYEQFLARVVEAGGEVHPLTVNFRSAPPILDEVAALLAPIMVRRPGLQPAFEPLVPGPNTEGRPGFAVGRWAPVEHWVSWQVDDEAGIDVATRSAVGTGVEAAALARDIASLHSEQGVAWGEIGLLFRAMSDVEVYLSALRERGVPYAVERDKSYFRRREVIDAQALVSCAVDPADGLAMLTWLRSPYVGVPDAALVPLWAEEVPRRLSTLWGPDPGRLDDLAAAVRRAAARLPPTSTVPGLSRVAGWEESLIDAIAALAEVRRSFSEDPADTFIDRLRGLFLVEATEAARYLGAWRLANLDRVFRGLLDGLADPSSGGDAHSVLRALRQAVAEAQAAEEGRPAEAAEDAVRVMTIHKSKGLDFAHTYLLQAHKGTGGGGSRPSRAVRRGDRWELCLRGLRTLDWGEVEQAEDEVADAERVRLLYVAATRAKERLVVAGLWSDRPRPGSTMALLQQREPPPPPLVDLLGVSEAGWEDAVGARWKLASRVPEPAAGDRPPPADLPSLRRVRADDGRLEELATEARGRSDRPFGGAASAAAHEALHELLDGHEAQRAEQDAREEPLPRRASPDVAQQAAMAAGSAVHRFLEEVDLQAADGAAAIAAWRTNLDEVIAGLAIPAARAGARERADALLDRLAAGPLLTRLLDLGAAGAVLGREVPVLLSPARDGPVGFLAGSIDLIHRDPATGEIVIVDYKTDEVEGAALAARAAIYRPQGAVYARAIQRALRLDAPPRFELWFVGTGEVVALAM